MPDPSNVGGVANYYRVLRLHELTEVEYFYVNTGLREGAARRMGRLLANYLRFAWKMRSREYALVHVNPSLNSNSFFRDGLFLLIARLGRAPRLVFFRGWEDAFAAKVRQSALLRTFFRETYGSCSNFIVLGQRFAERLKELGVPDARVWIETTVADARPAAHGAAPPDAPDGGTAADRRVALFMSRLLISKGVQIAIDAVRAYRAAQQTHQPPLELWIAGAGPDEARMREYVAANGLDFVTFLGHIRDEKKWHALESVDIFLFPTCYAEGLSNAVLEAMLHGLPIVARPEGALEEVLVDGVHGFVTTSKDPAVFAACLRTLVEDPDLYRRISEHNRQEAARFARDQVAERMLRIYEQVRAS